MCLRNRENSTGKTWWEVLGARFDSLKDNKKQTKQSSKSTSNSNSSTNVATVEIPSAFTKDMTISATAEPCWVFSNSGPLWLSLAIASGLTREEFSPKVWQLVLIINSAQPRVSWEETVNGRLSGSGWPGSMSVGGCPDYINWCGKSQPEGDYSLRLVPDCMRVEKERRIAMMHLVVFIPLLLSCFKFLPLWCLCMVGGSLKFKLKQTLSPWSCSFQGVLSHQLNIKLEHKVRLSVRSSHESRPLKLPTHWL